MEKSKNSKHHYFSDLRLNARSVLSICLGIFLFLLFFQPFNLDATEFNSKLLTLGGFGGITLILLGITRFLVPVIAPRSFSPERWNVSKEVFYDFLFVLLNSVAYSFFARYVGKIPITFHAETIIVIIGTASIVILVVTNKYHHLKSQVNLLTQNTTNAIPENKTEKNIKINFESENKSDYFQLFLEQIMLIKSANNYIEVIYKEDEKVHKKLIRNTLKNTEALFAKYPAMVRCHRSCMVNKDHIKKASKGSEGLVLSIEDYPKEIHVSRQYVLKVKEALRSNSTD